jgi:hypothetical protein
MRLLHDWLAARVQARTAAGEEEGNAGVGDTRRALLGDSASKRANPRGTELGAARDRLLWRDLSSAGDVNSR